MGFTSQVAALTQLGEQMDDQLARLAESVQVRPAHVAL